MKYFPSSLLLVFALAAFAAPLGAQNCHGADSLSSDIITEINSLMGTDDTVRTTLGIPAATPSQVALVSNETICAVARQAVDSTVHSTNPLAPATIPQRALYVVTVGVYYAIVDPTAMTGEWLSMYFFDANWNYVNSLIGWR
ncbi:MAG: hypothetical protein H0W63_11620 [Gemmatimonadaceae bacterium]|nr:hypothetical protein [Gemmatimonadaceae bacterium]